MQSTRYLDIFPKNTIYVAELGKYCLFRKIVSFSEDTFLVFSYFLRSSFCNRDQVEVFIAFGKDLQVDSNSREGCAGFSKKTFDLCKI